MKVEIRDGEPVVVPDPDFDRSTIMYSYSVEIPTGARAELMQKAMQTLALLEHALSRVGENDASWQEFLDEEEHHEELRLRTMAELRERYRQMYADGWTDADRDEYWRLEAFNHELGGETPAPLRVNGRHWMASTAGCAFIHDEVAARRHREDLERLITAIEMIDAVVSRGG